jgi:hypothetical protein
MRSSALESRCLDASEWQVAGSRARAGVAPVGLDDSHGDPPLVYLVGAVREARPAGVLRHLGQVVSVK